MSYSNPKYRVEIRMASSTDRRGVPNGPWGNIGVCDNLAEAKAAARHFVEYGHGGGRVVSRRTGRVVYVAPGSKRR
jgi:hypothetical protein